jgi:hypothetical protein
MGVSTRAAILAALLAVVLVSAIGVSEYIQVNDLQGQNRMLSSEALSYSAQLSAANGSSGNLAQTLISHVLKLQVVNGSFFFKSEILQDYLPNATMKWSGTTMGLGGTYVGTGNISLVFQAFFGQAISLNTSIDSFNVTNISSGTGDIGANLSFTGRSPIWGAFNGTVSASYHYVFQNGNWLISQEDWNFESFYQQYTQV